MKLFDLTGQTAIVTGAATGIGEAIARRLAHAGATVAVADIDAEGATRVAQGITESTGGTAFPLAVDVTNALSVGEAVQMVLARTGRIDVLVNNAGIAGHAAPVWEQSFEDWEKVIALNMNSVFLFSRAVISHMRNRKYGRIVNIASIAGKEGNPRMAPYSATKAAVIGFTKSLAKEVATEGVTVNAVSPAVVRTRILEQLTPGQVEYMTDRIPMHRACEPEEVAAVVHFLASPDSSFVTGQCQDVSGGRATY